MFICMYKCCACVCAYPHACARIKHQVSSYFTFFLILLSQSVLSTLELSKQSTELTDPPVSGAHDAGVTST